MSPMIITLIVLFLAIVGFISGKLPFSWIGIACCAALYLTGVLTAQETFSGLQDTNCILMASMMVVSAGLSRTKFTKYVSSMVQRLGKSERAIFIGLIFIHVILVQFMTGLVAMTITFPMIFALCDDTDMEPSRVIYPLALTSMSCVGWLPVANGAAAYARYNGFLEKLGSEYRLDIWDLCLGRMPSVIAIVVFLCIFAWKMGPQKPSAPYQIPSVKKEGAVLDPMKEKLAYLIFALVTVGMLTTNITKLDVWMVALLGALAMTLVGVLEKKQAFNAIQWDTLLMLAGLLAVASALSKTGAADVVGQWIVSLLGGTTNPYIIGAVFFVVPLILTQFMSNTAVDNVFTPLAIAACMQLNMSPLGVLALLRVAGSCSFFTPMASPASAYAMSVGGYSMKDLVKQSVIPAIILCVTCVFFCMTFIK